MIPPSIVLIIYGLITETSIKALFTASFLPGFMLATFFIIYIIHIISINLIGVYLHKVNLVFFFERFFY